MDTIANPDIPFDANGICYYYEHLAAEMAFLITGRAAEQQLNLLVKAIKGSGRGAADDCVIGLSGGGDSTYLAYLAKHLGLRPPAIHFDNG